MFGKSLVKSSITGDIFEGISPGVEAFAPTRGYRPVERDGLSLELGGPWSFYREFWKAHDLDHLAELLHTPEVGLAPGEHLHLPVLIHNSASKTSDVTLSATVPHGWSVVAGQAIYPVDAQETYPVQTVLAAPIEKEPAWQTVVWNAESGGKIVGTITMRVNLTGGGLPQ